MSSFAFRDKTGGTPQTRTIKNNIFYNTRSGGGSNDALFFYVTPNIVIDYNDYGWSGTYFVETNSAKYVTLAQWAASQNQDSHSLILNPQFVKMDGILPTDYKTGIGLDGVPGLGITTDFGGFTRSTGSPTMGAWECFPVDVYNGSIYRYSYFTLKDAFDAINKGTWKEDLVIKLKGSTQETSTATLNASGTSSNGGTSGYNSLTIYPTRADVIVRGNLNSPVVQLNGADKVKFDGRVDTTGTTANMTISNLSTEASAGTIQFVGSAQHNSLDYCILRGAGTGLTSGVVSFSTASSGSGNDGNTINKCVITGVSLTDRPVNAIYSSGTTGNDNSGNVISENSIINNWPTGSAAYSIHLGPGTSAWTITGNSFYDTTAFVPSGAFTYSAIYIDNSAGSGHTITGNYIGGRMVQCLGPAMTVGSTSTASVFYPVYLNVGTEASSSVQGNMITNLVCTSAATTPFTGIYVAGGSVNVGTVSANTLGSVAGTGAVIITTSATGAVSYGMLLAGSGAMQVSNNHIGALSVTNSSTANAHSLYGIYSTSSGTVTISSNIIGSTSTAGSIQTTSTATGDAQVLAAIGTNGSGSVIIKGNTLTNFLNGSTYSASGNKVIGIYKLGSETGSMLQNYISNLKSAATTSTVTMIAGIYLNNGAATCANNVLNIGSNSLDYYQVYGIYETGVNGYTNSLFHNTVYLSGTISGTSYKALSYAYYKLNNLGVSDIRNNILFNERSSGNSSSKHYAIRLPGVTNLSINGNDYYTTGTYGVLGCMNTTDRTTLSNWAGATGQDAQSFNKTPGLLNAGGSSALDYKVGGLLDGVSGTGILVDFGGNTRAVSAPTIGAWEYNLCVEVYDGAAMIRPNCLLALRLFSASVFL